MLDYRDMEHGQITILERHAISLFGVRFHRLLFRSFTRGELRILEMIILHQQKGIKSRQIIETTGYGKSTVHRYIHTLRKFNLIEKALDGSLTVKK